MKRKILSLLLVLTLVISVFTACGKTPSANNNSSNVSDEDNNDNNDTNEDNEDNIQEDDVLGFLSLRKYSDGDSEYDDNGDTYECRVRCMYAGMELSDEDATLYPELDKALKALNEEIETLVTEQYEEYKEASIAAKNGEGPAYFPYFIDRDMFVRRADTHVLSVSVPIASYEGGAHGWYGDFPRSFDVKTGKEIKFTDIVKDIDKMYDYITKRLKEKYADDWDMFIAFDEELDTDPYQYYKDGTAEQCFYFNNKGITVIFNPYDIAAYAAGGQEIYIPYEGNEDLFVDGKYFEEHMDSFAAGIKVGECYANDIFGDGNEDTFQLYVTQDEWDCITDMYFMINGESYTLTDLDMYAFSMEASIIRTDEGKVYCYFEVSEFNDYQIIYVFEISKAGVMPPYSMGGSVCAPVHDDSGRWYRRGVITDPKNFYISIRTDILGTTSIYALSYVGANGMPTEYGDVYEFGYRFDLTLKQEFTADTVSEEGEKTGSITLKVGDVVKAYRTDNKTYVDLLTKDGTIVRFNVTAEYPYEIDGIQMDELFDGIMYAS